VKENTMSSREQEHKPKIADTLSNALRRGRIPLLVTMIVLAAFVIGYFGWTEWQRRARETSAVQAEKAQELYQKWLTEQDPDGKKTVEDELRTLLAGIRKSYPRQYAAQRASFILGKLEYQLEHWQAAADAFRGLATRSPKSYLAPLALMNAGISFERLGDTDPALAAYQKVVQGYPDSTLVPELLFTVGRLQEEKGDFAAAQAAYNQLEEKHPMSNWTKLGRNRIIALKVDGKIAE
jgi:tetratricopeptide (TPR) repeat protein